MKNTTNETKQWWETFSAFYQDLINIPIGIHYGPGAPFETGEYGLHLLGNLGGKRILEMGCGGAQCGIAMAKQGARVTGVDFSEEQLKFARELARKQNVKIDLRLGDIRKLPQIKSKSYDFVFSSWALLYIDDFRSCFKEASRVLADNGRFAFSMPHPFWQTIDPASLKIDQSYFKTGKLDRVTKAHDGTNHKYAIYKRTMSELVNGLIDAGFVIERIIEPDSRRRYKNDPWYGTWYYKLRTMKYVPPTIIFIARK